MPEGVHKLDTVFGVSRDVPESYLERENIDNALIENLARDNHIVIFGSSKQGKTCLRKHCLNDDDYIVVSCQNNWSLDQLHSSILKSAGYTTQLSINKTADGRAKVDAYFLQVQYGEADNEVRARLEIDPTDPNDIIAALNELHFTKFIVLEDFHYLPHETQQAFAFALKAFHEQSQLLFIIVAVWREENRLIVFNGDLTGRIAAIDADAWTNEQLMGVISAGEMLLNIGFPDEFKRQLIEASFASVYIVQKCCYRECRIRNVLSTKEEYTYIDEQNVGQTEYLVKKVVDEQGGRYKSFLINFAMGFQGTELEMYKWLFFPVITSDIYDLQKGLKYGDIRRAIHSRHPRGGALNAGNITQALQSLTQLQSKKDIKPFVLDYDTTNLVMSVVDKGFLIWLEYQDREELLEYIDLPAPDALPLSVIEEKEWGNRFIEEKE